MFISQVSQSARTRALFILHLMAYLLIGSLFSLQTGCIHSAIDSTPAGVSRQSASAEQVVAPPELVTTTTEGWVIHPCSDRPGAPFRKYEAFRFDDKLEKVEGRKKSNKQSTVVSQKNTNLESFLNESGITAFCSGQPGVTLEKKENAPGKPHQNKSGDANPGSQVFHAPIQSNLKMYYAYITNANLRAQAAPNDALAMKTTIHSFLSRPHLQQVNLEDVPVDTCPSPTSLTANQICVEQKKFTYDTAREVMFGDVDLRKNHLTQDYEVFDHYCQKWVGPAVFSKVTNNPDDMPGPGHIVHVKLMNVEHTWPQSKFTAPKGSTENLAEKTDLHHIFPTDTGVNGLRGNFDFAEVDPQTAKLMKCSDGKLGSALIPTELAGVTAKGSYFEPPTAHKGNVARALFYFSARYDAKMTPLQESYLKKWNQQDPPDSFEKARHEKVYARIGVRNPFIDHPEWANQVDFSH